MVGGVREGEGQRGRQEGRVGEVGELRVAQWRHGKVELCRDGRLGDVRGRRCGHRAGPGGGDGGSGGCGGGRLRGRVCALARRRGSRGWTRHAHVVRDRKVYRTPKPVGRRGIGMA